MAVHLPLQGHSIPRVEDCDQMTPMDCMEVEVQLGCHCVQDTEVPMDCCVPSQDREEEVQLGRVVGVLVVYHCVLQHSIQGVEVSPISTMEGKEQMALLWSSLVVWDNWKNLAWIDILLMIRLVYLLLHSGHLHGGLRWVRL